MWKTDSMDESGNREQGRGPPQVELSDDGGGSEEKSDTGYILHTETKEFLNGLHM